jgi:hypothetical protein
MLLPGNAFSKVLVTYPVDYQRNFLWLTTQNKRCRDLYKLTNNHNPNANKTNPALFLIVAWCPIIPAVHVETCPLHHNVYQEPTSTNISLHIFQMFYSYQCWDSEPIHGRAIGGETKGNTERTLTRFCYMLSVLHAYGFRRLQSETLCKQFCFWPVMNVRKIWGSRDGDYEECCSSTVIQR